jgi:hypothetical protein
MRLTSLDGGMIDLGVIGLPVSVARDPDILLQVFLSRANLVLFFSARNTLSSCCTILIRVCGPRWLLGRRKVFAQPKTAAASTSGSGVSSSRSALVVVVVTGVFSFFSASASVFSQFGVLRGVSPPSEKIVDSCSGSRATQSMLMFFRVLVSVAVATPLSRPHSSSSSESRECRRWLLHMPQKAGIGHFCCCCCRRWFSFCFCYNCCELKGFGLMLMNEV